MDDFYTEDIPSGDDLADELYRTLTPTTTFLLHKECDGQIESLWMNAYAEIELIVETYPPVPMRPGGEPVGLVREIPAKLGTIVRTFKDRLNLHQCSGWVVQSTTAYSADPWDVTANFDKPCEF